MRTNVDLALGVGSIIGITAPWSSGVFSFSFFLLSSSFLLEYVWGDKSRVWQGAGGM